jgi:hypothetical protein
MEAMLQLMREQSMAFATPSDGWTTGSWLSRAARWTSRCQAVETSPTGRGVTSAATMVAASVVRGEWAPDQC